MSKIAVLASYSRSLIIFRGDMIRDWVSRGHTVITCGPESGFEREIQELGASFLPVRLERTGLNPFKDLTYCFDLVKLFKKERPDIVFSYTIKPVIYGSLAASFCAVPEIFSMITGAGYAFEDGGNPLLKKTLHWLYRVALNRNKRIIFQNPDNINLFKKYKMVADGQDLHMVNGSGVNLENFPYSTPITKPFRFLLIGRLIPEKGVREFVQAARQVKRLYPANVDFGLLGPLDHRPGSITENEVQKWHQERIIEYYGETDNVQPFLEQTTVYVLPSYHEGTPRSVLEAMSTGRPVITTDAPGCRETVVHGENGFIVPVRDAEALLNAMLRFLENPEMVTPMGAEGRRIAEEKYDVRKVNENIARILGL